MTTLELLAVLLWPVWSGAPDVLPPSDSPPNVTVLLLPVTDWVFVWMIVCVDTDAWLAPLAAAAPLVATAAVGVTTAGVTTAGAQVLTGIGFQTGIAQTVFTSQH